jgi:hypothetical protein
MLSRSLHSPMQILFASAKLWVNNNMAKGITIKNPSLSSDNEGNEEE